MYNIHSHFIHIKTKWGLLHLKVCDSSCVRKAVWTHSTLHHRRSASTLLGNIQQLQPLSPKSHGAAGEERGSGPLGQSPQLLRACSISKCGQMTCSVSVHVTGVGALLLCLMIQPQEVFVAWCAAHPGFPKPHGPSEQKLPLTGPHPTLKGHFDTASPAPYPDTPRYKDLGFLSVKATDLHSDRWVLLLLIHLPNAASCHWKNQAGRWDLETGNSNISNCVFVLDIDANHAAAGSRKPIILQNSTYQSHLCRQLEALQCHCRADRTLCGNKERGWMSSEKNGVQIKLKNACGVIKIVLTGPQTSSKHTSVAVFE